MVAGKAPYLAALLINCTNSHYRTLRLKQSTIYSLLKQVAQCNEIYRAAGAVHSCILCSQDKVLFGAEDVGRHNAADIVAGMMLLNDVSGHDKIFYTTGRLTSEIVMKSTYMGIPVLLSRSGITSMGLSLAKDLNVTMIARAKNKSFRIYNNAQNIVYDAIPTAP